MKNMLSALLLSVGIFFAVTFTSQVSNAFVFRAWDGYVYGNVCRNGAYFQVVPYQVVNTYCFMPAWNAWGVISWE